MIIIMLGLLETRQDTVVVVVMFESLCIMLFSERMCWVHSYSIDGFYEDAAWESKFFQLTGWGEREGKLYETFHIVLLLLYDDEDHDDDDGEKQMCMLDEWSHYYLFHLRNDHSGVHSTDDAFHLSIVQALFFFLGKVRNNWFLSFIPVVQSWL